MSSASVPVVGAVEHDRHAALATRGLVKRYGAGVIAVDGLDLRVARGECFGLLGPNGAGKTTTLEILEGLVPPSAGEVEVMGLNWRDNARELRQLVGVTLQQTDFIGRQTVVETLRLFASFYARPRRVNDVIDLVSLAEKRDAWVMHLSGGQKQRLAIACAMVGNPSVLFLDEPTTGLDPQSRINLWNVVHAYKSEGHTVLLTTHYMEEAERLCDRIGIIDHGKLIVIGSPSELVASVRGYEIIDVAASGDITETELTSLPAVHTARRVADGFVLNVERAYAVIPPLLGLLERRGLRPTRLVTRRTTLEDVFVHLTGRALRE